VSGPTTGRPCERSSACDDTTGKTTLPRIKPPHVSRMPYRLPGSAYTARQRDPIRRPGNERRELAVISIRVSKKALSLIGRGF